MSMKRKVGFTFLLLVGMAFVIHAFTSNGTPEEYRLREITEAEFTKADQFATEMAGFARKNAGRDFAARCLDAKNPNAASGWRGMREFSKTDSRLVKVVSYNKEPERCRLQMENGKGQIGTVVCRRDTDGTLKLISFSFVEPAGTE